MDFDGVVLAGGRGRRLGGADKAAIAVGGATLLDRAIAALAGATRLIVVGRRRPTAVAVEWTCERPPGGGPVAALDAGLRLVRSDWLALLAVDMPFVDAEVVERLAGAASEDGSVLVDEAGRNQPLAAVYRTDSLGVALAHLSTPAGASMNEVVASLALTGVAGGRAARDCDTWSALEEAGSTLGR